MTHSTAKGILPLLAAIAVLLFTTTKAEAETVTHYTGHLGSVPVNVTIWWQDYNGLGKIWGTISYAGRSIGFNGTNSRPGYLYLMDADGVCYTLNKQNTSSTVGWQGSSDAGERFTLARRQ